MKNFFLSIFILISLQGQSQSWSVGIQAGENISTLKGDQQSDFRLGFVAGVNISHYLTKNLVMRLELNAERKGAQYDLPDPANLPEGYVTDYSLDYLSLPLLLRYSTSGKVRMVAGGGVSVDYLLRQQATFATGGNFREDELRRVDVDLVASAGVAYPLNKNITLSFELRSLFGMVEVQRPSGTARRLGRNISYGLLLGMNYYL